MKSRRADGRGGRVGEGINAASRELGVTRQEAQRAIKIDAIAPVANRYLSWILAAGLGSLTT